MIKPYKTCRIEPGKVRLAELAEHFGLDPEELRWFHNQYCPINDLIDPDIQLHVEVIYIPVPEMDTGFYKKQNSKNQVFEKSGRLSVPRFFEKRYGIIQTMRENGEEKMQIHYETELNKTGLNNLFIKRNPVYINKKRPDFLMDKWADEVGNIFYPLHLELYDNAKLRHIANFPEIQKRWKEKKKELGNYYKGKTAEDFLEKIDRQFEYRGRTQRGILDSWFFCLYFFPLYESFDKDKTYTFQVSLPVFPKKPKVGFEITLSLEGSVSESQRFSILAKGKSVDSRTGDEIEKGRMAVPLAKAGLSATGSFDFTYRLNAKDNSIYSVVGEVELQTGKKNRVIAFECYEQES